MFLVPQVMARLKVACHAVSRHSKLGLELHHRRGKGHDAYARHGNHIHLSACGVQYFFHGDDDVDDGAGRPSALERSVCKPLHGLLQLIGEKGGVEKGRSCQHHQYCERWRGVGAFVFRCA